MFKSKKKTTPTKVANETNKAKQNRNKVIKGLAESGIETANQTVEEINDQIKQLDSYVETGLQTSDPTELVFYRTLIDNINEGVIFVDSDFTITCWSRSAEQLTGLADSNMVATEFSPSKIGLATADGKPVSDVNCPVSHSMNSQKQLSKEFAIVGRSGREISIALTVTPIVVNQSTKGAIVLLTDLSAQMDMKRKLTELHQACSLDPLTRIANRAEFERTLREYARAHRATNAKCCIIVCDLDYFKKVNDTYGHNVGDQALIAFAQHLSKHTRSRDVVARYGGEEFVILCANCDIQSAVERAEQVRKVLNETPQQMLDGKALAASFGVAELGPDEDITEFFNRADKALYAAKQRGRNRVEMANFQSASDPSQENAVEIPVSDRSSISGIEWRKQTARYVYCEEFRTATPQTILANKIRGYILEVEAKVRNWEDGYVSFTALEVDPRNTSRRSHFRVDIEIAEAKEERDDLPVNYLRITVFAPKARLFRRPHDELHARLVADMRRYLMLSDETACLKLNLAATESGREE